MASSDITLSLAPAQVDVVFNAVYDTVLQQFVIGDEDGFAIGSDDSNYIQ